MSEIAIFSFGAVMFAMTTWATLAFFMQRFQQVHLTDLRSAGVEIKDNSPYTELHVPRDSDHPAVDPR
ncbi:MAG: hypothetical protein HKN07_05735 [Acidimicrobiia bacterium]|nr:hypothetical protein [Acidimicrobiia bacterium]NNF63745.1 hypothetical protein [Acidimicrobiia bacterium]